MINKDPSKIAIGTLAGTGEGIIALGRYFGTEQDLEKERSKYEDETDPEKHCIDQNSGSAQIYNADQKVAKEDRVSGQGGGIFNFLKERFNSAVENISDLRHQPVKLGSAFVTASSVPILYSGINQMLTSGVSPMSLAFTAAGSLYIGANVIQGLFLDKNLMGELVVPLQQQEENSLVQKNALKQLQPC